MKDFPFKSSFASINVRPIVSAEKDQYLAQASLADVGKFIPNIDTEKNLDLLPVAFNACVVNRVNKNGDVIDTPTALAMYQEFINKPINVEHDRKKVIGVILTAGFSEFGTDKPLSPNDVKDLTKPFNITLGGVIWKLVSPELSDLIEESNDESSKHYKEVSASWELGFTAYRIALMEGGKKNLAEATKIISDPEEIKQAQNKLVALGGDGKYNDMFAYRMPSYDVLPLGIGFTEKPAAEVKGVAVPQKEEVGQEKKQAFSKPALDEKEPKPVTIPIPTESNKVGIKYDSQEVTYKTENKISQSSETNVNQGKTIMFKTIKDITDESLKQATASAVTEFIAAELKKGSDDFETQKNALNTKLAKAEEEGKKANEALAELKKQVEALSKEKADREAVEKFNARMSEVVASFELDDEVRALVASELKAIASDEDYAKWLSKSKVLLKGFAKKAKDDKKDDKKKDDDKDDAKAAKSKADMEDGDGDEAKKKKAKASEATASQVVNDAIDNAKKDEGKTLPNGSTAAAPTMREKYAQAFAKDNFVIVR